MPSTYTGSGIELIGNGEQAGTWGQTTNTNLQIINRMTSEAGAIALSGTTHTLTISDGVLSDGQYSVLVFGGAPSGTNTVTISPNDAKRVFIVRNNTAQSVVLTQGSGGNVTVASGRSAIVYCDGAGASALVFDVTALLVPVLANAGVTADASELNVLDGITASTAELNVLDGITASTAELNILDGVTADTAEINILDGVTASTAELNILDGVTADATEINLLDGVTALSGSDGILVTGTAGTDGQVAQWNADGDVVGYTIPTAVQATWEAGTDTTDALVSPAKVKAAIDALTLGATAGASVGAVGTYAYLWQNNISTVQGSTVSGSSLFYASMCDDGPTETAANTYRGSGLARTSTSPSGTWRAMGAGEFGSNEYGQATLYLRIS
jgi:hypothetical protein